MNHIKILRDALRKLSNWPLEDGDTLSAVAMRAIADEALAATEGMEADPAGAEEIKTWMQRAADADDFPIYSGDKAIPYMKAEIADLRAALAPLQVNK